MHDAHRVRSVKHAHNRSQHLHSLNGRKSSVLFQLTVKGGSLDVFHDQINCSIARRTQVINGHGVVMTKAARGLAFALKTAEPFSVTAHLWRQDFDRDAIAEQNVARAIDRTHTAFAQQGFDLILPIQNLAYE